MKEIIYSIRVGVKNLINSVSDRLFGIPDAIIIGEKHTDKRHPYTEADIIKKYKPEYVLMEMFNGYTPEKTKRLVERYKTSSLEKLSKVTGMDLEEIGISKDTYLGDIQDIQRKIEEEIQNYKDEFLKKMGYSPEKAEKEARKIVEKEGVIPKNYKKLITTPFYELHPLVIELIEDSIEEKARNLYEENKDKSNLEIVVKLYRYKYYINSFKAKPILGERQIDVVLDAICEVGASLAGCDIEKNLPQIEFDEDSDVKDFIENTTKYLKSLSEYGKKHDEEREKTMGNRIVEYVNKRSTDAPAIAIVGKYHTRKDSHIYPILEDNNIDYRVINLPSVDSSSLDEYFYLIKLGLKD